MPRKQKSTSNPGDPEPISLNQPLGHITPGQAIFAFPQITILIRQILCWSDLPLRQVHGNLLPDIVSGLITSSLALRSHPSSLFYTL